MRFVDDTALSTFFNFSRLFLNKLTSVTHLSVSFNTESKTRELSRQHSTVAINLRLHGHKFATCTVYTVDQSAYSSSILGTQSSSFSCPIVIVVHVCRKFRHHFRHYSTNLRSCHLIDRDVARGGVSRVMTPQ